MAQALSLAEVQQYQSKSKARGLYDDELKTFLASGEPGWVVEVAEGAEGVFAGKQPNSVKTSFDAARKKLVANEENGNIGADDIQVISDTENKRVILINKNAVREATAA